jgi:hypothetical protein
MNDWMQQEVRRQAYEAGDPAAQTGSWVLPAPQGSVRQNNVLAWMLAVFAFAVALTAALTGLVL